MSGFLKKTLIFFLSFDSIGNLAKKISLLAWKVKFQRELIERKKKEVNIDNLVNVVFKDKVVLHGPFKGLRYPKFRSRNSSLYSKLIGSYETELHSEFEAIIKNNYDQILDVGCAEGYYAVGLALKSPNSKIYAYDIEKESRDLTKEMAILNKVENRVIIESSCTEDTLKNFKFEKKTLILSDCEGFEKFLLTKNNISNLVNTDLLIETHDWFDINISTNLEKLFKETHHIRIIQSIGDVLKAKTYKYSEFDNEPLETKYRIYEEGRQFTDEWLLCTAKK